MSALDALLNGYDFTVRLDKAITTLSHQADTASSTEEYYRLDEKKNAVQIALDTWDRINSANDVCWTKQHWLDLHEVVESKYRTTNGGEREGYSLVLDYMRAAGVDFTP